MFKSLINFKKISVTWIGISLFLILFIIPLIFNWNLNFLVLEIYSRSLRLTNFFKKYPLALGNPDLQLKQGRLTREIEENQAVYITLRQQYEIAKIEAEEDKLFINILDTGDVAVRKSKPKRLLILLSSVMFGLMSSVLIILNRNKLLFKK